MQMRDCVKRRKEKIVQKKENRNNNSRNNNYTQFIIYTVDIDGYGMNGWSKKHQKVFALFMFISKSLT